jgi:hypothetical protein
LSKFEEAVEGLRASGDATALPIGLLARVVLRRAIGLWDGAERDLDEIEEVAEPGPMLLFLCDACLERARLALARVEAFVPLRGVIEDAPPKPVQPSAEEATALKEEAQKNLQKARKLIAECGYHRRDKELAELEAVLNGEKKFAELPPCV